MAGRHISAVETRYSRSVSFVATFGNGNQPITYPLGGCTSNSCHKLPSASTPRKKTVKHTYTIGSYPLPFPRSRDRVIATQTHPAKEPAGLRQLSQKLSPWPPPQRAIYVFSQTACMPACRRKMVARLVASLEQTNDSITLIGRGDLRTSAGLIIWWYSSWSLPDVQHSASLVLGLHTLSDRPPHNSCRARVTVEAV